jgi:hypothetical protein
MRRLEREGGRDFRATTSRGPRVALGRSRSLGIPAQAMPAPYGSLITQKGTPGGAETAKRRAAQGGTVVSVTQGQRS